jgi:hypothetical protein
MKPSLVSKLEGHPTLTGVQIVLVMSIADLTRGNMTPRLGRAAELGATRQDGPGADRVILLSYTMY